MLVLGISPFISSDLITDPMNIIMKLHISSALFLLAACSVNPYKTTNKSYKQQARDYARVISQHPLTTGADSVPAAPYWVGTVNFNLRKPNFVIIHHTAQNGC